jgi:hypothetical protein
MSAELHEISDTAADSMHPGGRTVLIWEIGNYGVRGIPPPHIPVVPATLAGDSSLSIRDI